MIYEKSAANSRVTVGKGSSARLANRKPWLKFQFCQFVTLVMLFRVFLNIRDLVYNIAAVPNLFGTRDQFHEKQFFHGQGGGMVQVVLRAMGNGRWSFAHPPAAHLLLCGPVPVDDPGVEDPCNIGILNTYLMRIVLKLWMRRY